MATERTHDSDGVPFEREYVTDPFQYPEQDTRDKHDPSL